MRDLSGALILAASYLAAWGRVDLAVAPAALAGALALAARVERASR